MALGWSCPLAKKSQSQTSPSGFLHSSHYHSLLTPAPHRNQNYPAATHLILVFPPACQSVLRFMIYLELDYTKAQGQHSLIRHRPRHGQTQTFVLAASASLALGEGCIVNCYSNHDSRFGLFSYFFHPPSPAEKHWHCQVIGIYNSI